ncbi:hypothetical protein DAI43_31320 [Achromobacter xylosoxidans]|nr:hypothetical protein DAI43_31320 [Achromobacter xylosoxidans]
MDLITSTRMYDVAPAARAAWHALLQAAHASAGLKVRFVEHGWPTPIGELWERPGLCGVFMCGWPYVNALQAGRAFAAVAAVVPDWPAYEGLPRYRSEFLVRADCGWSSLADAAGSRYGWMVRDSQSGWNAPRAALAGLAGAISAPLFPIELGMATNTIIDCFIVVILGGLGNIRGVVAASLLIGMVRAVGYTFMPSWVDILTFAMLIATLLTRPQGLFSRQARLA